MPRSARDLLLCPTPAAVIAAVAFCFAADLVLHFVGIGYPASGVLDDPAHLATAIVVVAALRPRSARFAAALLIASVAIDLDHLPDLLGIDTLNPGTARPITHSFATAAAFGLLAAAVSRSRAIGAGVTAGMLAHFFRDVASEAGVPLLWPFSTTEVSVPYVSYAVALTALAAWAVTARTRERASAVMS